MQNKRPQTKMSDLDYYPMAEKLLANDPASKMLGIEIRTIKPEFCQTTMTIRDDMTNGYNVCHGGFIFTLADTALAFACAEHGKIAVSASAQIDFLLPAYLGDELVAEANVQIKSGRNLFCDIIVRNQENEVIALVKGRQVQMKNKES
jgi:acyl-CoA thioesterase